MQGGPPDSLSPRHRLVALALAAGRTVRDVAQATGLSEARIHVLKGSPLFQALIEEEVRRLRAEIVSGTVERLNREADRTLDRMIQLRDQDGNLPVAARMADSLADRIPDLAKRPLEGQDARQTVRLAFSGPEVSRLLEVLGEASGEPHAGNRESPAGGGRANGAAGAHPVPVIPQTYSAVGLDDVLQELPE